MYKQISENEFNKLLNSYEQGGTYQKKKLKNEDVFLDKIFSTPLYGKVLNIDTKKIVSELQKYEFHDAGVEGENDIGVISFQTYNLNVLNDKRFEYLKELLMDEFYLFTKEHMRYTNEFEITTSWFNAAVKGQSTNWHNHNNCMYSAVLYLQTDENSGKIAFNEHDKKRFKLAVKDYNVLNSPEWKIKPVDGLFIIFPSELYHKAQENESDIIRHSLAINFLPTGLLGGVHTDSHAIIKVEK